jgi:hypothetical protein
VIDLVVALAYLLVALLTFRHFLRAFYAWERREHPSLDFDFGSLAFGCIFGVMFAASWPIYWMGRTTMHYLKGDASKGIRLLAGETPEMRAERLEKEVLDRDSRIRELEREAGL